MREVGVNPLAPRRRVTVFFDGLKLSDFPVFSQEEIKGVALIFYLLKPILNERSFSLKISLLIKKKRFQNIKYGKEMKKRGAWFSMLESF